jgi:hypothetical protein
MYASFKISNVHDVKNISKETFHKGDVYAIEFLEGFNFGNFLGKIVDIVKKSNMTEDFNCERILFFTRNGKRFDFGCDENLLNDGDYFNVAIIRDDSDELHYAHQIFYRENKVEYHK